MPHGRPKREPWGTRGLILGAVVLSVGVGCFFNLDVPTIPPNPPPPSLTVVTPRPGDSVTLTSQVAVEASSVNGIASVTVLCGPLDGGARQAFVWVSAPYQGLVDFSVCEGVATQNPDGGKIPILQLAFQALSTVDAGQEVDFLVQFNTSSPGITVQYPPSAQPNSPFTVVVNTDTALSSFPIVTLAGLAATSVSTTPSTDGGQPSYIAFFASTPGLGTDNYQYVPNQPVPIEVLTDTDEVVRLTVDATAQANGNTTALDLGVELTRVVWDRFIPGVPAQNSPIAWAAEPVAYSGGLVLPLSTTAGGGASSAWIPGGFSRDDGTFLGFDATIIGGLDGGYSAVAINGEGETLFYELVARTGKLLLAPPPPATTPVVTRSVLGLVQVNPPLTHMTSADGGALLCLQDSVTTCSQENVETLSCLTDQLASVSATSGEALVSTGPPDAGFVAGAAGRYMSPNPGMCGSSWNFVDLTNDTVSFGPFEDPNGSARDCDIFAMTKLLAVGDGTFVVQLASGCDLTGLNEFPILRVGTGSTILGAYTAPLGTPRTLQREVVGVLTDGRVVTLTNSPPNTNFELWSMNPTAANTDIPDVTSPIAGLYDSADNLEGSLVARSAYAATDGSFALLLSGAPLGVGVLAFGPALQPLWFYLYPRITSTGNSRLVSAAAFGDVYLLDEFNSRAVSLRVEPPAPAAAPPADAGVPDAGPPPDAGPCTLCLSVNPPAVNVVPGYGLSVNITGTAPVTFSGNVTLTGTGPGGAFPAPTGVTLSPNPPEPIYFTEGSAMYPGYFNASAAAGVAPGAPLTVTVTGTSPDGGLTDTVTFTIQVVAESVTVTPNPVNDFETNGTLQFTASVLGTESTAVTWSIDEGAAGGSITTGGLYTAPSTVGTYHIRATLQSNTSVYGEAIVYVTDG